MGKEELLKELVSVPVGFVLGILVGNIIKYLIMYHWYK